jgi:hypothetical protein
MEERVMTNQPHPAPGSPMDADHTVEIHAAQPDQRSSVPLQTLYTLPESNNPTLECPLCGQRFAAPGGSLRALAEQRARELGGDDVLVTIGFGHHHRAPQPPGTDRALLQQRQAGGKLFPLTFPKPDRPPKA